MVSRHVSGRGAVADFGAHSGALLLRLQEIGFGTLYGIDLDKSRFDLPGAAFASFDLNRPFADKFSQKFDLVTAISTRLLQIPKTSSNISIVPDPS